MDKTLEVRIKHKRDTSANWTAKNPVLLYGEIIFVETDDGVKTKIGDGATTYNNLPFTDELLKSYMATNYVTKNDLQEALAALSLGFVATEADM